MALNQGFSVGPVCMAVSENKNNGAAVLSGVACSHQNGSNAYARPSRASLPPSNQAIYKLLSIFSSCSARREWRLHGDDHRYNGRTCHTMLCTRLRTYTQLNTEATISPHTVHNNPLQAHSIRIS